jgi:hypothetical protein
LPSGQQCVSSSYYGFLPTLDILSTLKIFVILKVM